MQIEYTYATATEGKWFIILRKGYKDAPHHWIPSSLCELFKHVSEDHHVPGYDGPQRTGSNNNITIFGGYATVLLNSITTAKTNLTKYDSLQSRPHKQPVIHLIGFFLE